MEDIVDEALEYILDFSSAHTGKDINKFIQLNTIINRLDIEKDTHAEIDATRAPNYIDAMRRLFPGIEVSKYMDKLRDIEESIFKNKGLGQERKQHSWMTKPGKQRSASFMPDYINNVYHDSGYKPREVISNPTTWITPGSFIDPARRDKPGQTGTSVFPSVDDNIEISEDFFNKVGFRFPLNFNASINDNNECLVDINIDNISVDVTRNSLFKSISGGSDYFTGNPEKNRAINNGASIDDVKRYTISKELSDFTQIVFAIINMISMSHEDIEKYQHCIFTIDRVVGARARLMGMQSCIQYNDPSKKDSHSVWLCLAHINKEDEEKELKKTYYERYRDENQHIINNIVKASKDGFFIEGVKYYPRENIKK